MAATSKTTSVSKIVPAQAGAIPGSAGNQVNVLQAERVLLDGPRDAVLAKLAGKSQSVSQGVLA